MCSLPSSDPFTIAISTILRHLSTTMVFSIYHVLEDDFEEAEEAEEAG